jgi:3-deoxy-D-manno-octulosonic-acid transferase
MIDFLYNIVLFLYFLIISPKIIYEYVFKKKYRKSIKKRLGFIELKSNLVKNKSKNVIWVHAVSVGETRSVKSLIKDIKSSDANAYVIVSSTTQTGHFFAKKEIPFADEHVFFPIDFSWIVKRIIKQVNPALVIFVETDFWYNFCKIAKKNGAKIALVSGKISNRSYNRFLKIKGFSKKLFSMFDFIGVQNKNYKKCFDAFLDDGKKAIVTGNLKLDERLMSLPEDELNLFRSKFFLKEDDFVITIASTHANEEKLILLSLKKMLHEKKNIKIFLVPRHPDRFDAVKNLLNEMNVEFFSYSDLDKKTIKEKSLILIDTMGFLNVCFQLSGVAIVGGSFVKVGGHNILEPIFLNVPAIFGKHMFSQKELTKLALDNNCAHQVDLHELEKVLQKYITDTSYQKQQKKNCESLEKNCLGAKERTFSGISNILKNI